MDMGPTAIATGISLIFLQACNRFGRGYTLLNQQSYLCLIFCFGKGTGAVYEMAAITDQFDSRFEDTMLARRTVADLVSR